MQPVSSELLRQIRQRPGMYVGDTGGYGLHRLPLLLLQAGAIAASEARGYEVRLHLEEGGACVFTFMGDYGRHSSFPSHQGTRWPEC